jgi:hypothetical protein
MFALQLALAGLAGGCAPSTAATAWHHVYDDAPLRVHLRPQTPEFRVGDTMRVGIYAVNTSDRDVLLRRNWREQVVLYHIHPITGEQVEWPARINTATWLDSADVVRLLPGDSFGMVRDVKELTVEDIATFELRVKLVGVKDYGRRLATWSGEAWSNPIIVTVVGRAESGLRR